jgi:hypothetical protein
VCLAVRVWSWCCSCAAADDGSSGEKQLLCCVCARALLLDIVEPVYGVASVEDMQGLGCVLLEGGHGVLPADVDSSSSGGRGCKGGCVQLLCCVCVKVLPFDQCSGDALWPAAEDAGAVFTPPAELGQTGAI